MNTENKKSNSLSIDNSLSKLVVVLGDAREGKGSSLLDRGIELLETVDESIEGSRVDNSLSEMRRVLGN